MGVNWVLCICVWVVHLGVLVGLYQWEWGFLWLFHLLLAPFSSYKVPHSALIWVIMSSIVTRYATFHWYPVRTALFCRYTEEKCIWGREEVVGEVLRGVEGGETELVCNVWKKIKKKENLMIIFLFFCSINWQKASKRFWIDHLNFFQLKQWW